MHSSHPVELFLDIGYQRGAEFAAGAERNPNVLGILGKPGIYAFCISSSPSAIWFCQISKPEYQIYNITLKPVMRIIAVSKPKPYCKRGKIIFLRGYLYTHSCTKLLSRREQGSTTRPGSGG